MNLGGLFFIDFEANNDIDHIVIVTKVVDIGNYRQLLVSSHTNDHRNSMYEEILDFSGDVGQYCILL